MSTARSLEEIKNNPQPGDPLYALAEVMIPGQGYWSEEDYLKLGVNRLIEYDHGMLEFLPMPTDLHQGIVTFFWQMLIMAAPGGVARVAPLKLFVEEAQYREPDVLFLFDKHDPRRSNERWTGADLVIEVVSDDDPDRDWVKKKTEYAAAGIPEYWIADPRDSSVTIFSLPEGEKEYKQVSRGLPGEQVRSVAIPDLVFDVTPVFDHE
ncbi:Uma2 family endonuclease [Calycomorphotria hydatis]|uniref:Putative restriction endonuclease domain-containing protein n=1 Tax=Calycomorphotria hydatis TaxID=2528027 RepID=A0A517T3N7_9PLAN|nr:Uma2 family endonuclease [Calycomorphotria hydatis]QDT62984.1 hypothetical protein V22_01820 [Calycomorphotria hydatis]